MRSLEEDFWVDTGHNVYGKQIYEAKLDFSTMKMICILYFNYGTWALLSVF